MEGLQAMTTFRVLGIAASGALVALASTTGCGSDFVTFGGFGTGGSGNGGSGNGGNASSGNGGNASSGNGGNASSGNGGSGNGGSGNASSGNGGSASSGNGGSSSVSSSSVSSTSGGAIDYMLPCGQKTCPLVCCGALVQTCADSVDACLATFAASAMSCNDTDDCEPGGVCCVQQHQAGAAMAQPRALPGI